MSDEELRRKLADLQQQRKQSSDLYDRFGDDRFDQSTHRISNEIAAIPDHILIADKVDKKLAEFTKTIQAYIAKRRAKNLPPVEDIWQTVKGFEQHHDPQDLGNSSLLKSILNEAEQLNIPDATLEQTARDAEKSV